VKEKQMVSNNKNKAAQHGTTATKGSKASRVISIGRIHTQTTREKRFGLAAASIWCTSSLRKKIIHHRRDRLKIELSKKSQQE
jgi:hypothetical protein